MKHSTYLSKWWCMLLMVIFGGLQAKAQDPYLEDFSSITSTNKLPEGWACKGDISNFEYETDKYHTGVGSGKKALAINGNTENYLITPKLAAGSIAFYLRQYSKTYSASAALYYCTEKDGEFTIGAQIGSTATLAKASTPAWSKFTYTLDKDSRVAILLNGVIDDFVAPMGIVEEGGEEGGGEGTDPENPGTDPEPQAEKHLQITAFSRTSNIDAYADASGNFSATFSVTVKNTGNVELTAEEVSVSITDAYTEGYKVLATAKATQALAANASATIPVEVTSVCISSTEEKVDFYAKEDLENTFYKSSSYSSYPSSASVYVQPYVAKFAIYEEGGTSSLSSYYSLDFGNKVTTTVSKNFEIRNAGAAPLEVSSITVPEGFTVDPSSFTVAGGEKQIFTVSLVPEEGVFGEFKGNVVITHALGTFSFPVKGTTIDPDNIMIDFASGAIPSNWTHSSGFRGLTYGGGVGSVSSTTTSAYLQSPRITIKEGKKLSFDAEKYGSSTSHLTLSYSANGKDWTEVKDYGSEMTASFKTFIVDEIPAGNWFIKFEGTYFDIDNITGFGYCTEPLVDLKISAVGYATFAPQYDVTIPEGIEVYVVESLPENDAVQLSPITGTIAKGEGVIVKGEPNAIIIFNTVETAEKHEGNLLVGTTKSTELEAESAYILYASEGMAVFSLCSAGTIAAGKAYLPATGATAAPTLKFVFNDATSIHTAVETVKTNDAYNIAGQKVASDYKGIVIKNGKRYLKK